MGVGVCQADRGYVGQTVRACGRGAGGCLNSPRWPQCGVAIGAIEEAGTSNSCEGVWVSDDDCGLQKTMRNFRSRCEYLVMSVSFPII